MRWPCRRSRFTSNRKTTNVESHSIYGVATTVANNNTNENDGENGATAKSGLHKRRSVLSRHLLRKPRTVRCKCSVHLSSIRTSYLCDEAASPLVCYPVSFADARWMAIRE
ncbi:hypothetical protein IF1G_06728 [Cordyceps javanica]|uniref:Uncharacterized protein n=1 Tax=Cordyceps javanica TaxID=43265 RepID=A0A545UZ38_9HYPO|nr:hypothetical protein IF1G_06728 [Cordyceps javanica]